MRRRILLLAFSMAAIALNAMPASAQDKQPFKPEELDQMLAPIALYPDQLLMQLLMAATFPQQVVEAGQWLQHPANAALNRASFFAISLSH